MEVVSWMIFKVPEVNAKTRSPRECESANSTSMVLDFSHIHIHMALPTAAAARNLACQSCRKWVLRSFIASIGGSPVQFRASSNQRRAFSTPLARSNEARERVQVEERREEDGDGVYTPLASSAGEEAAQVKPHSTQQNAHVPWYLQVESPIPERENAISARQKIPELPDHSPAILQPLLERISVELGMDDLSLLDLRTIDPPPALGANLLMIIGTARSEKHLHFSADKLCRWLRSEYRLSPYADGLLGRQELKLKLRRRAKRSKLLSAVGAKPMTDTELDEGIRTGWICVNVGRVEGGDLPKSEEDLARESNVVGFGTQSSGARIVVQLLTEEKRGEIDLDRLWTAVLTKSRKEKEALKEDNGAVNGAENGAQERLNHREVLNTMSNVRLGGDRSSNNHHTATATVQQQTRGFSTLARRWYATPGAPSGNTYAEYSHTKADHGQDESWSTLASLLRLVESMSPSDAMETLGDDFMSLQTDAGEGEPSFAGSTEFVKTFYSAMPTFAGQDHWQSHIQLLALAHKLGHRNVTDQSLFSALESMTVAGIVPKMAIFMTILRALLAKVDRESDSFYHQIEIVLDLLEHVEHYGYNALSPDILEALHQSFVGPTTTSEPVTLESLLPAISLVRLKRHLLANDMEGFWKVWDGLPRRYLARSQEMYTLLYNALAAAESTGIDLHDVRWQLSYWITQMKHEEPSVAPENEGFELALSIFKVLQFLDPLAEINEWREMRERCEGVLRAALQ